MRMAVFDLHKVSEKWLKGNPGIRMGESFEDYSWIQDFEADFPQKVSLKMLN